MTIIEKLGINGLSTYCANDLLMPNSAEIVCLAEEVEVLQENSNDMLEALIVLMVGVDKLPPLTSISGTLTKEWIRCEDVIEKATGKSWEEIKQAIQE